MSTSWKIHDFFFTWWGKSGDVGQLCMLYSIFHHNTKGATGSIPKGRQGNTGQ